MNGTSPLTEREIAHETATTIAAFSKASSGSTGSLDQPPSPTRTIVDILYSSVGFGVSTIDATDAACKAVRDALERSMFQSQDLNLHLVWHLRVGVPSNCLSVPVTVDTRKLSETVPYPLSSVDVAVGGLSVPMVGPSMAHTAVASLLAQRRTQTSPCAAAADAASDALTSSTGTSSTVFQAPLHNATSNTTAVEQPPATWADVELGGMAEAPSSQLPQLVEHRPNRIVHRSTSIDMLARISSEIHEQEPDNGSQSPVQQGNYNYRKLPAGTTPKNNTRLFVKHVYRDRSADLPHPDELDWVNRSDTSGRTPNAAFPLKLHETLRQIELDGLDDVVGWLPHGRSFKVFKPKEFVEVVLPRYFVITKKSSFLRQLNLYGFNRLSRTGPDQGSYYNDHFLRGLAFLSRRMQRQKVNGNVIRSAGNPDDEPDFSRYPVCPPGQISAADRSSNLWTNNQNTESRTSCSNVPQVSFPLKLQRILDLLESEGSTDIVSWLGHGRAFLVHDPNRFVSEIMPVYFNQSKYSSFQRQLYMYNFERITTGTDKGAYHHPAFLRGHPELALNMFRTRVNGKGTRRPGNPDNEPDFSVLEAMPRIPLGATIEIPIGNPSIEIEFAVQEDASLDGDEVLV